MKTIAIKSKRQQTFVKPLMARSIAVKHGKPHMIKPEFFGFFQKRTLDIQTPSAYFHRICRLELLSLSKRRLRFLNIDKFYKLDVRIRQLYKCDCNLDSTNSEQGRTISFAPTWLSNLKKVALGQNENSVRIYGFTNQYVMAQSVCKSEIQKRCLCLDFSMQFLATPLDSSQVNHWMD